MRSRMVGDAGELRFCLNPLGDSDVRRGEEVVDVKNVQTAVTDCSEVPSQ